MKPLGINIFTILNFKTPPSGKLMVSWFQFGGRFDKNFKGANQCKSQIRVIQKKMVEKLVSRVVFMAAKSFALFLDCDIKIENECPLVYYQSSNSSR